MIISVHIPKTAGTSFREDLSQGLRGRVFHDYGDSPELTTPHARANDQRRHAEMLRRVEQYARDYDAIHGHFTARKYRDVFADSPLVTFVRDPYQHAISSYEHASRLATSTHAAHDVFLQQNMTLLDLIQAFPNHQSVYFAAVPLEEFAFVGVTERYEQSVALFEAIFGIAMPRHGTPRNVNPNKTSPYAVPANVRQAVERHRAGDIELYHRANERLTAMSAAYGIS